MATSCETFGDFAAKITHSLYTLPSDIIEVHGDRYDEVTVKDAIRLARAKSAQSNKDKAKKEKGKKKAVARVITPSTPMTDNPTSFLTVKENNIAIQRYINRRHHQHYRLPLQSRTLKLSKFKFKFNFKLINL